jgi:DNA-binding response OmpR family regulator
MSGYMPDVVANHGVLELVEGFMEKPFSPHALLQKIREVLDRRSGGRRQQSRPPGAPTVATGRAAPRAPFSATVPARVASG